jgi:hypothetical protein
MSPSAQNEHPIISRAREAIVSFQPTPITESAVRDLRFHQKLPSVFGKVEADAKGHVERGRGHYLHSES